MGGPDLENAVTAGTSVAGSTPMLHETGHRLPRALRLAAAPRARAAAAPRRTAIVVVTLVLVVGAVIMLWPFVAPLVFAAWFAHLSRPLFVRFRRGLHGRERAAGLLTALLVVLAIMPLGLVILTLIPAAKSLLEQIRAASGGKGVLEALVSGGPPRADGKGLIALAREYGAGASKVLGVLASVSIEVMLGAFVFFAVFYAILVEGDRWWSWVRDHSPGDGAVFDRVAGAFHEAGRGLIVGSGLTALVQGGLATVIYAGFGVPRALLLGMLTVIGALVPMTGPMIVWVPVAAGLALTGQIGKAAGLAVLCAGLVGTIDNILRPWLSRRFHVGMPAIVVLVAMLGGVVVLGGWGLFLSPLLLRLAGEMLCVCRERRLLSWTT